MPFALQQLIIQTERSNPANQRFVTGILQLLIIAVALCTSAASAQSLTLNNPYGDPAKVEYVTDGIFAVLWDNTYDHTADAQVILNRLHEVRADAGSYGMPDPININQGYYYNVYITHGGGDSFPAGWGNSQKVGTDGLPYLVLWHSIATADNNIYHEAFHIFQNDSAGTGFDTSGTSNWYYEAAGIWYAAHKSPAHPDVFRYDQLSVQAPHLAPWHGWTTAPGDPDTWNYRQHRYGMSSFLYHLTHVEGVSPGIMGSGYTNANGLTPQQYLQQEIGTAPLREAFSNWATSNFDKDYLSAQQKQNSIDYVNQNADPVYLDPIALTIARSEFGQWIQPAENLMPRGWAYNLIEIDNPPVGQLGLSFDADPEGTYGTDAFFDLQTVVISNNNKTTAPVLMSNGTSADATIDVSDPQSTIQLVVSSMPGQMAGGHQNYPYSIKITEIELCNGKSVTVNMAAGQQPTSGDDVILGTAGNDIIDGGQGDDTICGLGGNDTINAGSGSDWVDGGDGDDIINGNLGADKLFGGGGSDNIKGGWGSDWVDGGAGNDTIHGEGNSDSLFGSDGDDVIYGGSKSDRLYGGSGRDELYGGDHHDLIYGGGGSDYLYGESGNDRLFGQNGNDFIYGDDGDDRAFGGSGNDFLSGGAGRDGLDGDDVSRFPGQRGDDTVLGGDGDDVWLYGGPGNDKVYGQSGNDLVRGNDGNDKVYGGPGNDIVKADSGDDLVIDGGNGSDRCSTGAGNDTQPINCE